MADDANSSVFSSLQNRTSQQAWTNRARTCPRSDEEGLFTNLADWRIDQMQRFGEVLTALEPLNHDWGMFGTMKSPDRLRHAVTRLGRGRQNQPILTLCELAAETGDPMAAALDIVFCRGAAQYGSNNSVDRFDGVALWLEQSREEVAAAASGSAADIRTELASVLGRLRQSCMRTRRSR